jgi:hypothetical protein
MGAINQIRAFFSCPHSATAAIVHVGTSIPAVDEMTPAVAGLA